MNTVRMGYKYDNDDTVKQRLFVILKIIHL